MKTNTFFLCFLLLYASIVFWGCPIQKPIPVVEILPEIKDNMVFKPGTYWIYIDSLSNDDMDSVYVISSKDTIVSQDEIYGNCSFTHTEMKFKSDYYQTEARQGVLLDCNSPNAQWSYINYDLSIIFFCGSYKKNGTELPIVYGDSAAHTFYDTSYTNFTIVNKSYFNVKVFSMSSIFGNNTLIPKIAYYSPHIGAIKKEMWDGKKWLLVRYNIVQ